MWRPRLDDSAGPTYRALADAIAHDLAAGRLAEGDRLPPQRDLADALGVTITTVTRAYQEAARRGLVTGEVGRGTFVRGLVAPEPAEAPIDLSINAMLPHALVGDLTRRAAEALSPRALVPWLDYQPPAGAPAARAAGAAWIERRGVSFPADRVLVTAGAQHAMAVAFTALASPGDEVLADEVTYAGMRTLAATLRLTLRPVALDAGGLRPDALDEACRASRARLLYTTPCLQNPLGMAMDAARRRDIARLAAAHDLLIVEDDTYGFLAPDTRLVAADAPDRTVVITALSKSVTAGLRVGYLAAPAPLVERLASAIFDTTVMASPITAGLAAALIADGTADEMVAWKREEMRGRQVLARRILGGLGPSHPASPHVWLPLALPWRSDRFAAEARARGVLVATADAFSVRPGATPRAVRVSLAPPRTRERLAQGLEILRGLVEGAPPAPAVV